MGYIDRNLPFSHTKWILGYHIVFAPKYRKKEHSMNIGDVSAEMLRQLCE